MISEYNRPISTEPGEWMSIDCIRCPHCQKVQDLGDYPSCDWTDMWREIYSDNGGDIKIECQHCDKEIIFRTFLIINVIVRDDKNNIQTPSEEETDV